MQYGTPKISLLSRIIILGYCYCIRSAMNAQYKLCVLLNVRCHRRNGRRLVCDECRLSDDTARVKYERVSEV